jgi:hypothetical protein
VYLLLEKQAQSPGDLRARAQQATAAQLKWDAASYAQKMLTTALEERARDAAGGGSKRKAVTLLDSIMSNLQFRVTNVHVRLEDDSIASTPFALGVTFSAFTTEPHHGGGGGGVVAGAVAGWRARPNCATWPSTGTRACRSERRCCRGPTRPDRLLLSWLRACGRACTVPRRPPRHTTTSWSRSH